MGEGVCFKGRISVKWLWISVVVLVLDQCTKLLADSMLVFGRPVAVIPFVDIRLAYNSGAAFSFLGDASGWQRWFFVLLALLVIGILATWLRRLSAAQTGTALALALILGGAAGNLIDRLVYGYVIDFIDLYYDGWHWPTFNVADSAISIGAALLLLDAVLGGRSGNKKA